MRKIPRGVARQHNVPSKDAVDLLIQLGDKGRRKWGHNARAATQALRYATGEDNKGGVDKTTLATNLAPGDSNTYYDIYRHDTLTGQTVRVSRATAGFGPNA